jgi:hypothetical protein
MSGFNYGGYGDGTDWSSESGGGTTPGGSTGNSGNNDNGGNGTTNPQQQQISAIRRDPAVIKKLSSLIAAARKINPYAKVTIQSITKNGVLNISVTELDVTQAGQIGLSGLVMGVDVNGTKLAIGNLATGHARTSDNKKYVNNPVPTSGEVFSSGATISWSFDPKTGEYLSPKPFADGITIKSITITGPYTYKLVFDFTPDSYVIVTVNNGNPNTISTKFYNWKGPESGFPKVAVTAVKDFIQSKLAEERDLLIQTSDAIIAVGQETSKTLGEKYKSVANEIAADIKNFQGKTIRNHADAMAALNRVLQNPGMKINAGDKDAIVNAWNHLNATDMAYKLGFLGKIFTAADVVIKIDKVREKSIEGYQTGNWSPLMLEVESWVLSGMASGIALGILAYVAPVVATTFGLPVTAVTILGIIGITLAASLIDDKLADKINNEVIRPAH